MDDLFYVVYDGPALQNNEMDVKELAPALLAIAEAIEEANVIFNQNKVKAVVNVKASFKTGSFGIELHLVQKFLDNILGILKNDNIVAGSVLLTYIGFFKQDFIGLLQLLKWLKNRIISKINLSDNNKAIIYTNDDEFIEVEQEVLKLLENYNIRKALEQSIAQPLSKKGIEVFGCCSSPKDELFIITKNEAKYFVAPEPKEELINEQEIETNLQPVNIAFKEDNKWRFTDGTNTFYAEIQDKNFLEKVNNNLLSFAKDDILKVKLYIKQFSTSSGIKTEYIVKKVLSHRRARKISLPLPK